MDNLSIIFLQTIKASLTGNYIENSACYDKLSSEDWRALINMAEIHKLLPLFYEVAHVYMEKAEPELALSLKRRNREQVMLQTIKTADFLDMYKKLTEAGLRPLVVKGITCRNLYPKPDLRVSSDEDMLIDSAVFESCDKALCEIDFYCEDDELVKERSYEISYRKSQSPLYIELHKKLFPEHDSIYSAWNEFFANVHENAVSENIQGVEVFSLEYTDHMLYLICHALKHFLHSGFGIRQVCDIIMFANAYGNKMYWQRLYENCEQIHALAFAASIFKIGEKYLNFDRDKACYSLAWMNISVDEQPMLTDLLVAGIYGSADMSRKHSSNITLNAMGASMEGKSAGASVLKTVFPSAKNLVVGYPYLKKNPWLLPVAWMTRLFKYAKESVGEKDNSATESIRIGQQRVELLKMYGVIEKERNRG